MGHVYFIEAIGSPFVKIGWTAGDPEDRLAKFQTGCPLELALVEAHPGSRNDEQRTHRRLDHARVRGEWFDRTLGGVEETMLRGLHALPSMSADEAEEYARELAARARSRRGGWKGVDQSTSFMRACLAAIDEWEDALIRCGDDDLTGPRALRADLTRGGARDGPALDNGAERHTTR